LTDCFESVVFFPYRLPHRAFCFSPLWPKAFLFILLSPRPLVRFCFLRFSLWGRSLLDFCPNASVSNQFFSLFCVLFPPRLYLVEAPLRPFERCIRDDTPPLFSMGKFHKLSHAVSPFTPWLASIFAFDNYSSIADKSCPGRPLALFSFLFLSPLFPVLLKKT